MLSQAVVGMADMDIQVIHDAIVENARGDVVDIGSKQFGIVGLRGMM